MWMEMLEIDDMDVFVIKNTEEVTINILRDEGCAVILGDKAIFQPISGNVWDADHALSDRARNEYAVGPKMRKRATFEVEHPVMTRLQELDLEMSLLDFQDRVFRDAVEECLMTKKDVEIKGRIRDKLLENMRECFEPLAKEVEALLEEADAAISSWDKDANTLGEKLGVSVPRQIQDNDLDDDPALSGPDLPSSEADDYDDLDLLVGLDEVAPETPKAHSPDEDSRSWFASEDDDHEDILADLDAEISRAPDEPHPLTFAEIEDRAFRVRSGAYVLENKAASLLRDDEVVAERFRSQNGARPALRSKTSLISKIINDLVERTPEDALGEVGDLLEGVEAALGYGEKKTTATSLVLRRLAADADARIHALRDILASQKALNSDISRATSIDRAVLIRAANAHAYLDGFREAVRSDPDFDRPFTGRPRGLFANMAEAASLTPRELLDRPGVGPVSLEQTLEQIRTVGKPCPALVQDTDERRYVEDFVRTYAPWGSSSLVQKVVGLGEQEIEALSRKAWTQISDFEKIEA